MSAENDTGTRFSSPYGAPLGAASGAKVTNNNHLAVRMLHEAIVECSGDAIYVLDTTATIQSWNKAAEALHGYSEKEAIGSNVSMLIVPELQAAGRIMISRALKGESLRFDVRTVTKTKHDVAIHISLAPLRESDGRIAGCVVIARDITEQKRAEAVQLSAHDTFRELVEKSPFGVYVIDADFRFCYVGSGVENVLGAGKLLGRDFGEVLRAIRSDEYAKERIADVRDTLETGRPHGGKAKPVRRGTQVAESFEWTIARITMPDGRFGVVCHFYDLSERERFEAALRESEETLCTALQAARAGVWKWEIASDTLVWSPENHAVFGVKPGSVRTRADWASLLHPDDLADARQAVDDVLTGRTPEYRTEFRIARPDGEVRWIAGHGRLERAADGSPLRMRGISLDVTEIKRSEAALHRLEARFHTLRETLRDPFVQTSMNGALLDFNQLFCDMVGYTPEELRALTYQDLTPRKWHAFEQKILRDQIIARGYSDVYEKEYRRKDGTAFPVELRTILSRDEAGKPETMWAIVRDISERKAGEARLRSLSEQLVHVARVSELSQVSAGIAHELNQPLTAILNYASIARRFVRLKNQDSLEKASSAIEKAGEQAIRASEIIRRMRAFVERRASEQRVENINEIAEEAVALALIGAKADGIVTEIQLAPDLPPVLADRVQIQQVLVNLMHNAIDALASSERREITVATAKTWDGAGVEVSVADTGPGISKELAARLFMPFVTTKPAGMGIGLAISRSIIEAHGGQLDVSANEGGGTVFRFTLPSVEQHVHSKLP